MRVNYFLPSVVREDVAPDLETGIRWLASAPRNPLGGYEWAGWTDDTTPRTDRPVRFNAGLHQYADAGFGSLRATYRYSPSFTYRA